MSITKLNIFLAGMVICAVRSLATESPLIFDRPIGVVEISLSHGCSYQLHHPFDAESGTWISGVDFVHAYGSTPQSCAKFTMVSGHWESTAGIVLEEKAGTEILLQNEESETSIITMAGFVPTEVVDQDFIEPTNTVGRGIFEWSETLTNAPPREGLAADHMNATNMVLAMEAHWQTSEEKEIQIIYNGITADNELSLCVLNSGDEDRLLQIFLTKPKNENEIRSTEWVNAAVVMSLRGQNNFAIELNEILVPGQICLIAAGPLPVRSLSDEKTEKSQIETPDPADDTQSGTCLDNLEATGESSITKNGENPHLPADAKLEATSHISTYGETHPYSLGDVANSIHGIMASILVSNSRTKESQAPGLYEILIENPEAANELSYKMECQK